MNFFSKKRKKYKSHSAQGAWHGLTGRKICIIIKVTDKVYKEETFDEAKSDIKKELLYQKYLEKVKELEAFVKIEKNEDESVKTKI